MKHFFKAAWLFLLLIPFCAGQSREIKKPVEADPNLECKAKVLHYALERRLEVLEADSIRIKRKSHKVKAITAHEVIQ